MDHQKTADAAAAAALAHGARNRDQADPGVETATPAVSEPATPQPAQQASTAATKRQSMIAQKPDNTTPQPANQASAEATKRHSVLPSKQESSTTALQPAQQASAAATKRQSTGPQKSEPHLKQSGDKRQSSGLAMAAAASALKSANTNANNDSSPTAPSMASPPVASANDTPATSLDVDDSKPKDFDGELATTNELPADKTIKKIEDYIVLDRDGKSHTFKSLYTGRNVARRVLVIFIRHFFCGNCQEYLRSLSESITTDALLRLPVNTFIAVVGCGDPALIQMYAEATNCPFPIYTDPKRALFENLGMVKTLAMGAKPAYMKKSMTKSTIDSISQALRFIPKGLALKSGDQRQVGGEFLFEPLDIMTPVTTPREEEQKTIGSIAETGQAEHSKAEDATTHQPLADMSGGMANTEEHDGGPPEEKRVTWCHRMKNTRDHAEIPELMEILGLDGQGQPISDDKRWSKALATRKGTGLTMASQMSQLNEQTRET